MSTDVHRAEHVQRMDAPNAPQVTLAESVMSMVVLMAVSLIPTEIHHAEHVQRMDAPNALQAILVEFVTLMGALMVASVIATAVHRHFIDSWSFKRSSYQ